MKAKLYAVVAALILATGCGASGPDGPRSGGASGPLSAAEESSLLFAREEEKVARDVYLAHGDLGAPFTSIAESEQRHMDAIGTLLDRYGLPDPAAGQPEGSFVDPDLAALYESLMTEAAASTEAALAVGATIEEVDIRDLRTMRASIDNADILNVYDNLERGSRNHLRSFYGTLIGVGGAYAPKYLTQADFDAIVTSEMETGGGGPNW